MYGAWQSAPCCINSAFSDRVAVRGSSDIRDIAQAKARDRDKRILNAQPEGRASDRGGIRGRNYYIRSPKWCHPSGSDRY